jgi:nucleotide-binding universal stress UspA family protein
MNKILVPVDFSETSSNALSYAVQLFGASDLEITVLHMYGVRSGGALLMKNIDGVLQKDAQQKMDDLLKTMQNQYPEVIFKPKMTKNEAIPAIVAMGDSGTYDFIVMGTKGASGLKEVFLGSVAGGVVSRTTAPVLVVPMDHAYRPLEKIVMAIGNDTFSSDTVITPLKKIAALHQSEVKVLHIADKKTPQIEEALLAMEDLNPTVDYAFGSGNVNKDLNDYLTKDFSGLACLIRTKKGFFERLFNESVTLKQTFSSAVPLLILHDLS